MLLLLGQLLAAGAGLAAAQAPDSARLVRSAVRAEATFESSIRRFAPIGVTTPNRGDCDEIVGRYCVYYDPGRDSLPAEPAQVALARDSAIKALQRAAPIAPPRLIHSLVRLLIEAGRSSEAVEVARAHARANSDAEAHMLVGFALHADRRTVEAIAELDRWLALLPRRQRDRITDLTFLLENAEKRRYRSLSPKARQAYEARAWRFADPLYLTPGNEVWADHLARHAVSRMFESRGYAPGASWGGDLEQLTIRFGMPVRTTKSWRAGSMGLSDEYSDHWDPTQRTYLPPSLTQALAAPERLDTVWPLDTLTSRSGHAPPTLRVMGAFEGQVVAFQDEIRVAAAVAGVDSLVTSPSAALILLDSALAIVASGEIAPKLLDDSVVLRGTVRLPDSAHFYSLELYDPNSRFGARKRFAMRRPAAGRLSLSNIMLAEPFAPGQLPDNRDSPLLQPLTRPVLEAGRPLGLFAEVTSPGTGRKSVAVEIEARNVDRGSPISGAIRWIGRRLGLSSRSAPTKIGWVVELRPDGPTALALTLDLGPAEPGRYRVTIRAKDGMGGDDVAADRDFLVVTSRTASSRRP